MLKLKNDLTIDELKDLLACLERTQGDLKKVISNREHSYKDDVKEDRLIKDMQELKLNSESVYGGKLPPLQINVLD